jgi:hypothetical protein
VTEVIKAKKEISVSEKLNRFTNYQKRFLAVVNAESQKKNDFAAKVDLGVAIVNALAIVEPATVIRWHRAGFSLPRTSSIASSALMQRE